MSTATINEGAYTPGRLTLNLDGDLSHRVSPRLTVGILPFDRYRPNLVHAVHCWNACVPLGDNPEAALDQVRADLKAAEEALAGFGQARTALRAIRAARNVLGEG